MLDLGDGAAESIESLVADATAQLPRDSAAAAKHRLRTRLTGTVQELQDADGARMSSLFFPVPTSVADILPMTLTCGEVAPIDGVGPNEVTQFLLSIVKTNATAKPVDADGVVALRTHSFRDVTGEMAKEARGLLDDVGVAYTEADVPPDPRAFQLRVSYLFAAPGTAEWQLIVGSATVPTAEVEHEVNAALLGLFDAMVSTLKWEKEVALA